MNDQAIIAQQRAEIDSLKQQIELYRSTVQRLSEMVDEGIKNFRELNRLYSDTDNADYSKLAVRVKTEAIQ